MQKSFCVVLTLNPNIYKQLQLRFLVIDFACIQLGGSQLLLRLPCLPYIPSISVINYHILVMQMTKSPTPPTPRVRLLHIPCLPHLPPILLHLSQYRRGRGLGSILFSKNDRVRRAGKCVFFWYVVFGTKVLFIVGGEVRNISLGWG